MNTLIERIDDEIKYIDSTDIFLLIDCKAEIERLLLANETLKGLCEDYQAQIKQQREYTPMTNDELYNLFSDKPRPLSEIFTCECREIEAEVIKRAGLIVKENV